MAKTMANNKVNPLSMDLSGIAEVNAMIDNVLKAYPPKVLLQIMRKAVKPLAEKIKADAPKGGEAAFSVTISKSGEIKTRHIGYGIIPPSIKIRGSVKYTPVVRVGPYGRWARSLARWVEFGVKAHDIYPKKGRKLYMIGRDRELIAVDKVHHPGIKARPFIRPAFDSQKAQILATISHEIERKLRKAVK